MRLDEFLLARVAEDEVLARAYVGPRWVMAHDMPESLPGLVDHVMRHSPQRVLAECEAKRRIVEEHRPIDTDPYASWKDEAYRRRYPAVHTCPTCKPSGRVIPPGGGEVPCTTLLALAQPYADHPDFDPAWRTG